MGHPSVSTTATGPRTVGGSQSVNRLNIGLILLSFGIALYLPFELFLFSYAILGPGHYLTEISWLQKRRFFTKGSYDAWVLAALAAIPSAFAAFTFGPLKQFGSSHNMAGVIGFALGAGLVFFLTSKAAPRLIGLLLVALASLIAANGSAFLAMILALFVPTLIHVYVFTGFFILFGALKERSSSGYLTFALFLLCPLLYLVIRPLPADPNNYIVQSYWHGFSVLNTTLLGLAVPHTQAQMDDNVHRVFGSSMGLVVMRFIAFAYTYHYLNWFSKTAIIKWHEVSKSRLRAIAVLWAGCVVFYLYNYAEGVKLLFCLSFLHVFLEFPLNHMSIIGVFKQFSIGQATALGPPELRRSASGTQAGQVG